MMLSLQLKRHCFVPGPCGADLSPRTRFPNAFAQIALPRGPSSGLAIHSRGASVGEPKKSRLVRQLLNPAEQVTAVAKDRNVTLRGEIVNFELNER